ncbi:MAG: ABC transporter ATP-binding protein [Eubacterium sp.]|nr:ABC transporter ATP-binding protein [Eubacterium sp.]
MIEIRNVTKTYGKNAPAVDDLSFTVQDGEIVGFIGPNGAGKTTTIRMLTGILRPDSGKILLNGIPMAPDAMEAKRIVGYISDNPDMFLKLTGYEFVGFMSDIYGVSDQDRKERTAYFSEQFGMTEVMGDRMQSYSHGMRQKAMIIAALVHDPAVWILDEPMIGLDPQSAFNLKRMMREHAAKGNSVLFSTHVLEVAEKLCDRVIIISHGRQRYYGTLDELKSMNRESDLEQVFLELMKDDAGEEQHE